MIAGVNILSQLKECVWIMYMITEISIYCREWNIYTYMFLDSSKILQIGMESQFG